MIGESLSTELTELPATNWAAFLLLYIALRRWSLTVIELMGILVILMSLFSRS